MRPTRTALALTAAALAPALLLATPAFASSPAPRTATVAAAPATDDDSTTPVDEMSEDELRAEILRILAGTNTDDDIGVIREANKALDGTVENMRAFLKSGYRLARAEDDRVAIFRILAATDRQTDKAVVEAINNVLNDGTPEALRAFLETGYRLARAEDDFVAVFRILAATDRQTDKAVVEVLDKLLENGRPTPEELRTFHEIDYPRARAEDDRVAIFRILSDPNISSALRAAAVEAIRGTPEEMRYFLEHGQYEVTG